jgi:hypothetical protein
MGRSAMPLVALGLALQPGLRARMAFKAGTIHLL